MPVSISNLIARLKAGVTDFCYDCGRAIELTWSAPDELWEEVAGTDNLCIRCFQRRATKKGYMLTWQAEVVLKKGVRNG